MTRSNPATAGSNTSPSNSVQAATSSSNTSPISLPNSRQAQPMDALIGTAWAVPEAMEAGRVDFASLPASMRPTPPPLGPEAQALGDPFNLIRDALDGHIARVDTVGYKNLAQAAGEVLEVLEASDSGARRIGAALNEAHDKMSVAFQELLGQLGASSTDLFPTREEIPGHAALVALASQGRKHGVTVAALKASHAAEMTRVREEKAGVIAGLFRKVRDLQQNELRLQMEAGEWKYRYEQLRARR